MAIVFLPPAAGLPHRDAFAPSRTARRLAEWAWELPTKERLGKAVKITCHLRAGS